MQKIIPFKAKIMMDENPDAIILDVRELGEYVADGHIAGSTLIPVDELAARYKTELPDKSATILVHCRSGKRSARACELLDSLGYENIYDFGGLIDWPFEIER